MFPTKIKLKKTFFPSRVKIKKWSDFLLFGEFGLKLSDNSLFSLNKIQSVYNLLQKLFKKFDGFLWIRAFPHYFLTKKPLEVRMGNGKGSFFCWAVNLPKGFVFVEFSLKTNINLYKLVRNCCSKIGVNCKLIKKNDIC